MEKKKTWIAAWILVLAAMAGGCGQAPQDGGSGDGSFPGSGTPGSSLEGDASAGNSLAERSSPDGSPASTQEKGTSNPEENTPDPEGSGNSAYTNLGPDAAPGAAISEELMAEIMPDIQKLYEEMGQQGVNVIGFVANFQEDRVEKAQEILAKLGVSYQNVVFSDESSGAITAQISGYPTTIFVDSTGKAIGGQVAGARSYDEYKALVEERKEMAEDGTE